MAVIFRNLKTGNILTVENKDVIEVMTSSPNYKVTSPEGEVIPGKAGDATSQIKDLGRGTEEVVEAVATPTPPAPGNEEEANKGDESDGEKAAGEGEKKPKK